MILRVSSHRALARLKALHPDAESVYHRPTLFDHDGRGFRAYMKVDAVKAPTIKGVTRAQDQNLENYGHCWS